MNRSRAIICLCRLIAVGVVLAAPRCLADQAGSKAVRIPTDQERSFASILPKETIGYASVHNVPDFLKGVQRLPAYKTIASDAFLEKVIAPRAYEQVEAFYTTYVEPLGGIVSGELALVVTTVHFEEGKLPFAFLADVRGNEPALQKYIDEVVLPLLERSGGWEVETSDVGGVKATSAQHGGIAEVAIRWAVKQGVLVVAFDEDTLGDMLDALGGDIGDSLETNERFAAARRRVGPADYFAYVDIGAIIDEARRQAVEVGWEDEHDESMALVTVVTGFRRFETGAMGMAFTPQGVLTTMFCGGEGPQGGVFGALARPAPPLKSLAYIPADTGLFVAVNAGSPKELLQEFLDVVAAYEEAMDDDWGYLDEYQDALREIEDVIGMDLDEEVLPAFGGEVVVASGVPDTLAVPPAVAMIEIKDKAAAAKVVAKVLALIEELAAEDVKLTKMTFEGVEITTISANPMVTPSVAIVGDFLVVGTHPNAVKKIITTKAGGATLADDADYKKYINGLPGNASVTLYLSVKRIFDVGYPILASQVPAEPEWEVEAYLSNLVDALGMLGESFSGFGLKVSGDKGGIVIQSLGPNGGIIPGSMAGMAGSALYAVASFHHRAGAEVEWDDGDDWVEEDE
jgi:hypothetical protein